MFLAMNAVFLVCVQRVCAQDAADIIRHSVERDATNFERFKNYTFLERVEERRYGRNGNLSSKEVQTYEFMVLGGRPYGKLVERDDKALPAKEARKTLPGERMTALSMKFCNSRTLPGHWCPDRTRIASRGTCSTGFCIRLA